MCVYANSVKRKNAHSDGYVDSFALTPIGSGMDDLLTPADVERFARVAGLSMAEVCRRAQIAQSTFCRWKAGHSAPRLDVYTRIRSAVLPQSAAPRAAPRPRGGAGRNPVIDEAVAIAGGAAVLAAMLRIKPDAPDSWKEVPAHLVLAVEAATGIPRSRLRPTLYPPEEKPAPEKRQRAA